MGACSLPDRPSKFWAPTRDSLVSVAFDGKEQLKPEGGNVPFVEGRAGQRRLLRRQDHTSTPAINTPFDIDDPFTFSAWI